MHQIVLEAFHPVDEVLLTFTVVVKVDLDIADPHAGHFCQRLQQFGPVFLLGIEEGVLRRVARAVPMPGGNLRPCLTPFRYPLQGVRNVCSTQ